MTIIGRIKVTVVETMVSSWRNQAAGLLVQYTVLTDRSDLPFSFVHSVAPADYEATSPRCMAEDND